MAGRRSFEALVVRKRIWTEPKYSPKRLPSHLSVGLLVPRQHAGDDDERYPGGFIRVNGHVPEADAPVTDPKTPLLASPQLDDVAS
jgi:hypothetical protein